MPSSRCCQESSSFPLKEERKGEQRSAEAVPADAQADGRQGDLQLLICKEKKEVLVSSSVKTAFFGLTLVFHIRVII